MLALGFGTSPDSLDLWDDFPLLLSFQKSYWTQQCPCFTGVIPIVFWTIFEHWESRSGNSVVDIIFMILTLHTFHAFLQYWVAQDSIHALYYFSHTIPEISKYLKLNMTKSKFLTLYICFVIVMSSSSIYLRNTSCCCIIKHCSDVLLVTDKVLIGDIKSLKSGRLCLFFY